MHRQVHIPLMSIQEQPDVPSACEEYVEFAEKHIDKTDAHTSAYAESVASITSTCVPTYVIVVKDVHTCPTIALNTGVNFATDETTVPPCARTDAYAEWVARITSTGVPTYVIVVKDDHTCPAIVLKTVQDERVKFAMDETTVPPCVRKSAIATLGAFIPSVTVPTYVVVVKHQHISQSIADSLCTLRYCRRCSCSRYFDRACTMKQLMSHFVFIGQKYPRTLEKDLASICRQCHIDEVTLWNFLNQNYDSWSDFARHFVPEFVSEVQATVRRRYSLLYQDNAMAMSDLNHHHPPHFPIEGPYSTMPKCQHCGCWFFRGEGFGSLKCCHDGILPTRVKPLQSMPSEYRAMLLYDVNHFRQHLRALNTCLSFSSIGVKYGQFEHLGHPSCIRVSGKLYHRMLHAEADGPLRYYVHDPMFEGRSDVVQPTTLESVQSLIENHNPFASYLRQLGSEEHEHHMLQLSWKPAAQQSAELASIVYKPDFCAPTERNLCVYRSSNQFYDAHPDLQPQGHDGYFIPMQHPLGDAMQYPLLFWGAHKDGGYCWQSEHELANHERNMGNRHHHKVSLLEHARYHVLAPERSADGSMDCDYMLLTQGGHVLPFNRFQLSDRLAGEWLINSFVKQEDERLKFHRSHANLLTGQAPGTQPANSHVATNLHRSVHGSPAHMKQKVSDGLHIVHKMGKPLFFITFTCNPNWSEIREALLPGQTASDQPVLTCRVFKMKLDALLGRLKKGLIFRAHYRDKRLHNIQHYEMVNERGEGFIISVIEYQKRGLPHAHIAYRPACNEHKYYLKEEEPCEWVDNYVTGQIPDDSSTPHGGNRQVFKDRFGLNDGELDRLRELVQKHMLHDKGKRHANHLQRRGEADKGGCLDENGNCVRYYPRPTTRNAYSSVDEKGYVVFERHTPDDTWVVPYNPHLLLMFDCHCNVEIAGMVNIIFYLYKYLYKGTDKARFQLRKYREDHAEDDRDKIDEWLIGRYVSSMYAAWRTMDFKSYINHPSVTAIVLHLPGSGRERKGTSNQDKYFFRPSGLAHVSIAGLATNSETTKLGLFELYHVKQTQPTTMTTNASGTIVPLYVEGDNMFRSDTVPCYTNATTAHNTTWWYYEKKAPTPSHFVRLENVSLTAGSTSTSFYDKHVSEMCAKIIGELWYFRMLLLHKTPTSYDDLLNHETVQYDTYQGTAKAMGLLDNYNEAYYVFQEAVELEHQSPSNLRTLFVMLTMQSWPTKMFLDRTENPEWVDAMMMDFLEQSHHNAQQAYNRLLQDIQERLDANCNKTNADFGLPPPQSARTELEREMLRYDPMAEQRNVTVAKARVNASGHSTWTQQMDAIYDEVCEHLDNDTGDLIFVQGKAGVGKTTLNRVLLAECRAREMVGLVCAPTALAASLYENGMTCHEACKLNVVEDEQWESYLSRLQAFPGRCELLIACRLLIIDEVYNLHRGNFNAMITALQTIRKSTHHSAGMIIVCTGDIHQIPPVVQNGSKSRILNASVVANPTYQHTTKFHLTIPQRTLPTEIEFRALLDQIGADTKPHATHMDDQPLVQLDDIHIFTDETRALLWAIPNITSAEQNVVLTASNARVNELNTLIQERNPNPPRELLSSTSIKSSTHDELIEVLAHELIATSRKNDVPPHALTLKKGDICFLMATLSKKDGIVKNQRLRILEIGTRLIQAELLLDEGRTRRCLIPRFRFNYKHHQHIEITRLQFPLRLAYACTINKSQGQTFSKVLLDSKAQRMFNAIVRGAFSHGHLYVALGRVRQMAHVAILVDDDCKLGRRSALTANIVFSELLAYV